MTTTGFAGGCVFSPQMHNADDSCEVKTTKWDFCNREHQRTSREAALRPNVLVGKGIPSVAFDIAHGILKHIGRAIDGKLSIHRVMYAENTMSALHEGHISERSHDVVFDRRERAKPDGAIYTEFRRLDIQCDTVLPKPISGNIDLITLFLKIRVGEWNMEGLRISYQLYGTVF